MIKKMDGVKSNRSLLQALWRIFLAFSIYEWKPKVPAGCCHVLQFHLPVLLSCFYYLHMFVYAA